MMFYKVSLIFVLVLSILFQVSLVDFWILFAVFLMLLFFGSYSSCFLVFCKVSSCLLSLEVICCRFAAVDEECTVFNFHPVRVFWCLLASDYFFDVLLILTWFRYVLVFCCWCYMPLIQLYWLWWYCFLSIAFHTQIAFAFFGL